MSRWREKEPLSFDAGCAERVREKKERGREILGWQKYKTNELSFLSFMERDLTG